MTENPILSVRISRNRVDAIIKSFTDDQIYGFLATPEGFLCSCPRGFHYHQCKHITAVISYLAEMGYDISTILGEPAMLDSYIKTALTGYNNLMGGIPMGAITGIYGEPEVGKSTFCLEACFDMLKYYQQQFLKKQIPETKNILWWDTESRMARNVTDDVSGSSWITRLSKRYGLNVGIDAYRIDMAKWLAAPSKFVPLEFQGSVNETAEQKIIVVRVGRLHEIMLAHGRDITIDYGKVEKGKKGEEETDDDTPRKVKKEGKLFMTEGKGKITVKQNPSWKEFENVWDLPVAQWLKEYRIGGMVYDSITALTNAEFSADNPSFPGRSSVTLFLFNQIVALADYYNLPVITTHHASHPPDQPWAVANFKGGDAIGYNHKYWLYMKFGGKSKLDAATKKAVSDEDTLRSFQRARHPAFPPGSMIQLKFTSEGFLDI